MERTATIRRAHYTGIALVISSIVAKCLGAIYRIPLTNILGAEGIGMYQLVFPVYALILTLSSSGIPTAISRLVAEHYALGDLGGVRGVVKTSAILLGILGVAFVGIMLLLALPLARVQGNGGLAMIYASISPAVLFVACSNVIKGYFEGSMNLLPTALTNLVEQVVKMCVGLILASYLMRYGVIYGVTGAVVGVASSEAVSLLILIGLYMRHRIPKTDIHVYNYRRNTSELLRVSLPIAMSGICFPLMQVVDSLLIVNILSESGMSDAGAIASYGLLMGPVGTLINMPIVVTIALAVLVVPLVSSSRILHDVERVRAKSRTTIKLSYMVCAPAFVGMFLMAGNILRVLYPTLSSEELSLATGLLRVSSVSILLVAETHIYTSLLEALDKSRVSMLVLMASIVLKGIFDILFITRLGIMGAVVGNILTFLFIGLVDSLYVRHYLGGSRRLFESIVKVLVSSLIMGGVVLLVTFYIRNIYISLVVALVVGVAIYVLLMLSLRVMEEDELLSLPMGKLLIYCERRLHPKEKRNDRDNRTRHQ